MGLNEYRIEYGRIFRQNMADIALQEGITEQQIEEALSIVYRALRVNPHGFELMRQYPPLADIRYAARHMYMGDGFIVPPLRLSFVIKEESKVVLILGMKKQWGFGDLDL